MGLPIKSLFMKGSAPAPAGVVNGCLGYTTLPVSVAPMPCIAEQYDNGNWHDILLNSDRFVVPSGVSLIKVCGSAQIASGSSVGTVITRKTGAAVLGQGFRGIRPLTNGVDSSTSYSAVLAVSPGDYFGEQPNAGTSASNYANWVGIEALDSATKYALVHKSADQAIGSGSPTILTWNSEVADVGGWHDNVTQNSRFTVPSGVSRVKVSANVQLSSASNVDTIIELYKNGIPVAGGFRQDFSTGGTGAHPTGGLTATLDVTPGEYFEVRFTASPALNVAAGNSTWFCIEEVVPDYARTLATKTSSQSINTTPVALTWASTIYNGSGAYSGGSPTRLTVPSGKSYARIGFNVLNASAAAEMRIWTTKNGANFVGEVTLVCDTSTAEALNGVTPWLPVTPGDYFEIMAYAGGAQSVQASDNTWFFAEFI